MPLIVMSGLPLSGKTSRSVQLQQHFYPKCKVILINEESLNLPPKNIIYSSVVEEKKARSEILSATERSLDTKSLVIVDSLNYIKGFRYQLYCIARAIGTTHCVIHCSCEEEQSLKRLESSCFPNSNSYSALQIHELAIRYENPDPFAKWDKPLFRVNPQDSQIPMLQEIENALFHGFVPPPNLSTITKPTSNTEYLPMLDAETKGILQQINLWIQKGNTIGICTLQVGSDSSSVQQLPIKRKLSQSELLRLQKHFISLNKQLHSLPPSAIASTFVDFLAKNT